MLTAYLYTSLCAKIFPIEEPYVDTVVLDQVYMGYCGRIHLEQFRSKLINDGQISKDTIDSKFYALIWIQVCMYFNTLYSSTSNSSFCFIGPNREKSSSPIWSTK